jgi:P pilus assembly chaperone PapD
MRFILSEKPLHLTNFLCALLAMVLLPSLSYCFEVDKMVLELSASGPNTKGIIKVKNKESYARIVNIEVSQRNFSGKKEELKPTSQLVIDKTSLALEPGKEEILNVEWKGKSDIKASEAFRVVLVEVKKNLESVNSLKDPLLSYSTSVFVSPEAATEKIDVKKAEIHESSNKLVLTLKNSGKRHRLFFNTALEIKDLKSQEILAVVKDSVELQQVLLMPGQTKTIDIFLSKHLKKKPVIVSLKDHE